VGIEIFGVSPKFEFRVIRTRIKSENLLSVNLIGS
jgi:hypothetical protein